LLVLACAPEPLQPPSCPPDPFADVVAADTGWRARVQAQALSVPRDTTLVALIAYRGSVTEADRAVLRAAGASITSEWQVITGLAIHLSAGQLLALTTPGGPLPDSRVEFAELGTPVCLAMATAAART
jgi:hypothetical protein